MKYAMGGKGPIGVLKYDIVPITRGKVLEIGRGSFKVWPHFVAIRERGDSAMVPTEPADLWVDSFESMGDLMDDAFDAVVLHEGIDILKIGHEALRVIKDGGYLVEVSEGALLVEQRKGDAFYAVDKPERAEKTACVVRYGAIGDMLQAGGVVATLKSQGYHVTLMCEPRGDELLKHDPNIDRFWTQDKEQVPNAELPAYWDQVKLGFDKWVNLCETVEGTLLAMPGRAMHAFPQSVRHSFCNRNYSEFMAEVAELSFVPELRFYDTPDEAARADEMIKRIADATNPGWLMGKRWQKPFVIMWALSGSAVHKTYPHQDAVFARILHEIPHAHIITVGDDPCRILEAGWENEPRVHCRSGEMALRDTLALARKVDLVIGPETGVLNAVSMEDNAKIVLLSHSTAENLTKHWVNTEAIASSVTPCYPCHQLHYVKDGFRYCAKHEESSTAQCQWDIPPADVWALVQRAFVAATTVRRLLETA